MKESEIMVNNELRRQREKWGLEHDIEVHGSDGLAYAARIILDPHEPSTSGHDGNEWYFELWRNHRDNPEKRYAIAAAMLHSAIECRIYERGIRSSPTKRK